MPISLHRATLVTSWLCLTSAALAAERDFDPNQIIQNIQHNVRSCEELWDEVQKTECGNQVLSILRGAYIALGVSAYTLDFNLSRNDTAARFNGALQFTPHYSINTGPRFFEDSEFGYAFSLGFEQAHALRQTIKQSGKSVTTDLDTYAISNLLSTEASFIYAHGFKDATPNIYFLFGIGFGLGYGDVAGKAYITENVKDSNPACYQATLDFVQGVSGATEQVQQDCELASFHRAGFGMSARLNLNFRYRNIFVGLQTQVIEMNRGNWFSLGSKRYNFSPAINSITLAYLFDL